MQLIELNKFKKARVSFEEVPSLISVNYEKMDAYISATEKKFNEMRTFVIELMLPSDASYYVLLGAKYIPLDEKMHLEIHYSDNIDECYTDTLAYDNKTVYKGLSKEYVKTVIDTAREYLQSVETPTGKIIFDVAAFCVVGSSPLMFRIATKIVLQILLNKEFPISGNYIKDICESSLEERNNMTNFYGVNV